MARKKKYREEDVIKKAVNVFWKNGYTTTSIRQLEAEMGINQFSIYASFGNKKGVFLKALEEYRTQAKEIFLSKILTSEGKLEDITTFLHDFVESVKSGKTPNGCLIANTAMDMGDRDEEVFIQVKLFFELLKEAFIELLEKSKVRGELSKDANTTEYANYLVVCIEGLAISAKILNKKELSDFIKVTMKALK